MKLTAMPGGRGTPRHAVRIPDELWLAAQATAHERGETLSDIVRTALEHYIATGSAPFNAASTRECCDRPKSE